MNKLLVAILGILVSNQSYGAVIESAKIDAAQENILIDVFYSGGCAKHLFSLKLNPCMESSPVQCTAELVHNNIDDCEAVIGSTVVISLKEYGLDNPYYKGGTLKITGDKWNNNISSATVKLP